MTIREQITNVVRALAKIPAVVEMAREDVERRREQRSACMVELERTQKELAASIVVISELQRRIADEQELSDAQSEAITELQSKNAACSARIRELETQAMAAWRATPGDVTEKPAMADLWRPIGDDRWCNLRSFTEVVVCGGAFSPEVTHVSEIVAPVLRSHYIVLEPPR